jgi:hypothetical protein
MMSRLQDLVSRQNWIAHFREGRRPSPLPAAELTLPAREHSLPAKARPAIPEKNVLYRRKRGRVHPYGNQGARWKNEWNRSLQKAHLSGKVICGVCYRYRWTPSKLRSQLSYQRGSLFASIEQQQARGMRQPTSVPSGPHLGIATTTKSATPIPVPVPSFRWSRFKLGDEMN